MKDQSRNADELIWWYCEDRTEEQVWSDLDDEEIATLVNIFIRRGQRSASAAKMVRAVAHGSDYLEALIITVPRTIRMVDKFQRAPRTVRRREQQRERRGAAQPRKART